MVNQLFRPKSSAVDDANQFFSSDYMQARERFLHYANKANALLDHYRLQARGPAEELLHTDFAWIGPKSPKKVFIVQSGVHGVEAFAGAAVQCRLLNNLPALADDMALVLVHVLNPYGMAWLRRVNESNVDLNRNCLAKDQAYCGVDPAYATLNALINPATPPGRDFFLARSCLALLRYGFKPLRQAIACGQYEYPAGLFYGGARLEEEPRLYRRWLMQHAHGIEQVSVVDLHTGLGKYGQCQVFPGLSADVQQQKDLMHLFGDAIKIDKVKAGAYDISGGIACLIKQVFELVRPTYLTVEFGTYAPLRVLHALREENRCHFYTEYHHQHPARQRLKEMLCPSSAAWKELVLERGCTLVDKLAKHLTAR